MGSKGYGKSGGGCRLGIFAIFQRECGNLFQGDGFVASYSKSFSICGFPNIFKVL